MEKPWKSFLGMALVAVIASGGAGAEEGCEAEHGSDSVKFVDSRQADGSLVVRLSWKGQDPLEVRAEYAGDSLRLFRTLEPLNGRSLSAQNQADLRSLVNGGRAKNLSKADRALADFLVNFAPADFPLRKYEPRRFLPTLRAQNFTSICGKLGKVSTGVWTTGDDQWWQQKALVGKAPQCFGRCGPGCGPDLTFRRYTQECFNHDLCSTQMNDNLGPCEAAFWAAADGFFNAPSCP